MAVRDEKGAWTSEAVQTQRAILNAIEPILAEAFYHGMPVEDLFYLGVTTIDEIVLKTLRHARQSQYHDYGTRTGRLDCSKPNISASPQAANFISQCYMADIMMNRIKMNRLLEVLEQEGYHLLRVLESPQSIPYYAVRTSQNTVVFANVDLELGTIKTWGEQAEPEKPVTTKHFSIKDMTAALDCLKEMRKDGTVAGRGGHLTTAIDVLVNAIKGETRIADAIELAVKYGGIDGAHHKDWVIDQMVRVLAGTNYDEVVRQACDGQDGPNTYTWETGIAP